MVENKIIGTFSCIDDNLDKIEIIESICFNTKVLNFKCFNNLQNGNFLITDLILDKKNVIELCCCLEKWIYS